MITARQARQQTANAKSILDGARDMILTEANNKIDDKSRRGHNTVSIELRGDLYTHDSLIEDLIEQARIRKLRNGEVEDACTESTKQAIKKLMADGYSIELTIHHADRNIHVNWVMLKISW